MKQQTGRLIFKSRFSLLSYVLPTIMLVVQIYLLVLIGMLLQKQSHQFELYILIGIAVLFLGIIIILPTMRYELQKDILSLRCGPFRAKIPYSEIKKIIKTDLVFHPIASCRWPGFALGDCYYADWGHVWMCATSMCKNIILIQTTSKLYGVTPKDEIAFIEKLKKKTEEVDEC
ncbi:MAG: PH domain-containing protein [bacterium]